MSKGAIQPSRARRLFSKTDTLLRQGFGNPQLRSLHTAFIAFSLAGWSLFLAMLVYAFERGGATETGVAVVVLTVPAALFGPFLAVFADRHDPARFLLLGYLVLAAAQAATGFAILTDEPLFAYAAAAVGSLGPTTIIPTQRALFPGLAVSAQQLTASDVLSTWIVQVCGLVAPVFTGVVLNFAGPKEVCFLGALLLLGAAILVLPVKGAPAAIGTEVSVTRAFIEGFRTMRERPAAGLLVGLNAGAAIVRGGLSVLIVFLAVDSLNLGQSWVAFLNSAFGMGAAISIVVTVVLLGRRGLWVVLLLACVVWAGTFTVLGVWSTTVTAVVLLIIAGGAMSMFDHGARILLMRVTPAHAIARIFALLEGASMAAFALGSMFVPLLLGSDGSTVAFLGLAAVLLIIGLICGRFLPKIDESVHVPQTEIALLRSLPVFAPLGAIEIELLARKLGEVTAPAETVLIRDGDPGDLFYVIADGEVEIIRENEPRVTLRRGNGFGEIALIKNIPRTATVVAKKDVSLYTLDKSSFLEAITKNPRSQAAATQLADERMPKNQPSPRPE